MARHLKDVTDPEWERLMHALVAWLKRENVAGSIAHDYSLYNALDDERSRAKDAPRRAARLRRQELAELRRS